MKSKRLIALVLVLLLTLPLCGCDSLDYSKAVKALDNGDFDEAEQLFRSLGDYKDSEEKLADVPYQHACDAFEKGNYEEAELLFRDLGENKDSLEKLSQIADCYLEDGLRYYYCLDDTGFDKEAAASCFTRAAALDNGIAFYYLGELAMRCADKDRYDAALDYYEQAIAHGCDLGLLGKGELFEFGQGRERDYAYAKQLYEEALSHGCVEANYDLGILTVNARGVPRDGELALEYLTRALESDDPGYSRDTFVAIGDLYERGIGGIELDYSRAIDWYRKGIDAGSTEALCSMAFLFENGLGVERDYKEAVRYCQQAAENGSLYGKYLSAVYTYNGWGVEQDESKAEQILSELMDEGYGPGYVMAGGLARSRATDADYALAAEYYQNAVWAGIANGFMGLARIAQEKNDNAAMIEAYEQAAAWGNSGAMNNLARIYHFGGKGIRSSFTKAISYYEQAVEAGNALAMGNLAGAYMDGIIIRRDMNKGHQLASEGAIRSDSWSIYLIARNFHGHLYGEDEESSEDASKAVEWFAKGIAIGNDWMREDIDKLVEQKKITQEEADQILEEQMEHLIFP